MIRWTDDKRELLRKRWTDGYMIKTICRELGCGQTSLKQQCKKMGLPRRGLSSFEFVKVRTSPELYKAIGREAFNRNMSIASYVRLLIRRDIGFTETPQNCSGSIVTYIRGEERSVL